MKKMPKKLLDELIAVRREYWEMGDQKTLHKSYPIAESIQQKVGVNWLASQELIDSILVHKGFNPEADNDVIYRVLEVLGWEVTDEDETSESV